MVQRSKHAPWKCKLEHFGLQKSGAYRMIHSLHNQTELLPEIQLAYTDIHFLENWSSIQIDSFVAHKQRNDSAQLLNWSKLEHLRHSIPRYFVKNILIWSFFNFLTLSEWFVEQLSIWLTNFYSHKSLWIWYQGNWLRTFYKPFTYPIKLTFESVSSILEFIKSENPSSIADQPSVQSESLYPAIMLIWTSL